MYCISWHVCGLCGQYWVPSGLAHHFFALSLIHSPSLLTFSDGTMVAKADKVKWSQANDVMLVHMLTAIKNKGDWGDNNPKKLVWVECTKALVGSKKKSGRIAKWPDTIRGRLSKVPHLLSHTICYCTDEGTQLKLEYDVVKELWGLSGFGWDATLSTGQADPDVWTAYIKVRSGGTWIHRLITHICS